MSRASKRLVRTIISIINSDFGSEQKTKELTFLFVCSNQDVIGYLETVAQQTIDSTGFFHSGPEPYINAMRRSHG